MSNIKTTQLGIGASLVIVLLAFGAFASAAALITKNQFSLAPFTSADENEDEEEDEEEDKDEDEKDDKSEEAKKKAEREQENTKKQAERARESAKKQLERSNKNVNDDAKDDNDSDEDAGDDGDENEGDDIDEDENDEDGMFKDRAKTLEKLRKEIAEAKENILEKQAEGVDVTAALARLGLAEASLGQVGSSFDANNLEAAKMLAKQIKKTAHFAKEDLHDAEKVADELAKVEKRFGQVAAKIAGLEALGGDASAFKTQLAGLKSDFAVLQSTLAIAPGTLTRDTVKAFEKRVKRLKSLLESAIFALGGTDDDDLFADHEDDAADLFEDLDDVAEIEDGDDNGVSGKVRSVAAAHKAAATTLKESLQDIKGRSALVKTLFGPDSGALETLGGEIAAMNARAAALESAAAQVTDPDIKQILISQASTLRSEVLKLQAYITAENNTSSLFGWLSRLF